MKFEVKTGGNLNQYQQKKIFTLIYVIFAEILGRDQTKQKKFALVSYKNVSASSSQNNLRAAECSYGGRVRLQNKVWLALQ